MCLQSCHFLQKRSLHRSTWPNRKKVAKFSKEIGNFICQTKNREYLLSSRLKRIRLEGRSLLLVSKQFIFLYRMCLGENPCFIVKTSKLKRENHENQKLLFVQSSRLALRSLRCRTGNRNCSWNCQRNRDLQRTHKLDRAGHNRWHLHECPDWRLVFDNDHPRGLGCQSIRHFDNRRITLRRDWNWIYA